VFAPQFPADVAVVRPHHAAAVESAQAYARDMIEAGCCSLGRHSEKPIDGRWRTTTFGMRTTLSTSAGLQTRFLAAARASVDEVGEAAADIQRGLLSCGQPLNQRIYGLPSTDRAELVLGEYRKRGYFPYLGGE
jgi:hypothetical protein